MKQDNTKEYSVEITSSDEERSRVSYWGGLYEGFLFENAPASTYERYSRAISKFFSYFPEKKFVDDFLRCHAEDFKERRLKEGASPRTVGIELSILRGFWRFLVRMEAAMLNPFIGVKVGKKQVRSPDIQIYEPRKERCTSVSATDDQQLA